MQATYISELREGEEACYIVYVHEAKLARSVHLRRPKKLFQIEINKPKEERRREREGGGCFLGCETCSCKCGPDRKSGDVVGMEITKLHTSLHARTLRDVQQRGSTLSPKEKA